MLVSYDRLADRNPYFLQVRSQDANTDWSASEVSPLDYKLLPQVRPIGWEMIWIWGPGNHRQ